jgi:hypothetical protein
MGKSKLIFFIIIRYQTNDKDIPRDNADMSNEKGIPRLKLMEYINVTVS